MNNFDFELWIQLANENPAAFETLRKQYIDDEISKATPSRQARLAELQSQIDVNRAHADTALGACINISKMMARYFSDNLKPNIDRLADCTGKSGKAPVKNTCEIITLFKNK